MVKLDKEKKTTFISNNWIKFFLGDFFLAGGIDCASNNMAFIGIFCIVAGIGLLIQLMFVLTKDW